jgi:hypothetical protein
MKSFYLIYHRRPSTLGPYSQQTSGWEKMGEGGPEVRDRLHLSGYGYHGPSDAGPVTKGFEDDDAQPTTREPN